MILTKKSDPKKEKDNKNSPKKTRKSHELQEGNQRNHEIFHILRGQILYKMVKEIYADGAGK
jgi:hypothetical protein